MMVPRGHSMTLYSNEGAEVPCENVTIFSESERAQWFGSHDKEKLDHLDWNQTQPYWQEFNIRCIRELWKRVKKGDFILTTNGNCAEPVANSFPGSHQGTQKTVAFVEAFCGYYGTFSRYRIFESHTHAEWLMGAAGNKGQDTASPSFRNYWDMRDFPIVKKPDTLKGVESDRAVLPFHRTRHSREGIQDCHRSDAGNRSTAHHCRSRRPGSIAAARHSVRTCE